MKMMGLQNTSFYLSWIITYFIIYTIISIIASILLTISVFKNTSGAIIFFDYWLFCMNMIFEALFVRYLLNHILSVFFTKALFGLICAIVWYLLKFMVIVLVSSQGTSVPKSAMYGASLSSHAAFSFSFDVMI
jgi:ATP-binding cassette subfamily A (ABC1) protein 3